MSNESLPTTIGQVVEYINAYNPEWLPSYNRMEGTTIVTVFPYMLNGEEYTVDMWEFEGEMCVGW